MRGKALTKVLSMFLLLFYIAIIMYVLFPVQHIYMFANFEVAMAFEIIGFALLAIFIVGFIFRPMKLGFAAPLVIATVVYTVILDVVNIFFIITMPHVMFVLVNFILLFIYCLISGPIYIMGRR